MFPSYAQRAVILVLISIPFGCSEMRSATTIHVDLMNQSRSSYGDHFKYMVDNAILSDMSIADIHFVSHTTELSGVGAVRLERIAKLLNTYGGTIRYETAISDEAMLAKRMDHAREFLVLSGCELDHIDIEVSAPGGLGMSGREGVAKYQRAITVSDDDAATGSILSTSGN